MVPDLSAELLGNIFSVGVTAGLPTPELLLLLDRCWTVGRTGRTGGGRSWAPARRADSAGLKVVIISAEELQPRRTAASGSRMTMVCSGLAGSELTGPGGFFRGSRVSSTTSGACLTVFCLSSSRNSCRAVLMVFSMSWGQRELWSALFLGSVGGRLREGPMVGVNTESPGCRQLGTHMVVACTLSEQGADSEGKSDCWLRKTSSAARQTWVQILTLPLLCCMTWTGHLSSVSFRLQIIRIQTSGLGEYEMIWSL